MTSYKTNYLPKARPSTLVVRVSIYEFWEDTNIQSITLTLIEKLTKNGSKTKKVRKT